MKLFENRRFVLLPNCRSSTLKFLSHLIQQNGGELVNQVEDVDENVFVLINDSFVDEGRRLIQGELFQKEFDLNPGILWDRVLTARPVCVKASCISEWLKEGTIDVSLKNLVDIDPPMDSIETVPSEAPQESQSETDVGSQTSTDGMVQADTVKEAPSDKTVSFREHAPDLIDRRQDTKNETLIKALGILAKRYDLKGDQFRSRGYKLAKIGIERYPFSITSGEQAQKEIASVGPSIARKLQIILDTGGLPGLNESFDLEKRLDYFTQCHDVGIYSAKRWNLLGLKTFLEVAHRFPDDFVRDWPVLFGWSYYEDWSKSISREECETILGIVRCELKMIDSECEVELQGSYVRGAQECGDIDLLFFKVGCDDTKQIGAIMEKLALRLYNMGYVQCFLQLTSKIRNAFGDKIKDVLRKCRLKVPSDERYPPSVNGLKKFFLGFRLPLELSTKYASSGKEYSRLEPVDQFMSVSSDVNPCRRVDFFCCKWSELGAARLQWTGPKEFNRWIRISAMQKGMKLTQHGLYKEGNVLLESFDERRIFELLGEEYVGPEERNTLIRKKPRIQ